MMHGEHIFYSNAILLFVSVLQVVANLVVSAAYFRSAQCRRQDSIILLVSLAAIDFFYALLFIPFATYLLVAWQPGGEGLNYNPYVILGTGSVPASLMKSGCTIVTFIAVDRIAAIYFPIRYYGLKKRNVLLCGFAFSLFMAAIDCSILFWTTTPAPHPGCATFACFTSKVFQTYWGVSNMVVNAASCVLTLVVVVGLRKRVKQVAQSLERERSADKSATRTAVCILVVSAIFGVLPGLINGSVRHLNIELLSQVEFFVQTSASVSGLTHAFIFGMAHRDVRRSIFSMFRCQPPHDDETAIPIRRHSLKSKRVSSVAHAFVS